MKLTVLTRQSVVVNLTRQLLFFLQSLAVMQIPPMVIGLPSVVASSIKLPVIILPYPVAGIMRLQVLRHLSVVAGRIGLHISIRLSVVVRIIKPPMLMLQLEVGVRIMLKVLYLPWLVDVKIYHMVEHHLLVVVFQIRLRGPEPLSVVVSHIWPQVTIL